MHPMGVDAALTCKPHMLQAAGPSNAKGHMQYRDMQVSSRRVIEESSSAVNQKEFSTRSIMAYTQNNLAASCNHPGVRGFNTSDNPLACGGLLSSKEAAYLDPLCNDTLIVSKREEHAKTFCNYDNYDNYDNKGLVEC